MTDRDRDESEKPSSCPWCHGSEIREVTTTRVTDTRWFICQSCARVFFVRFERRKSPEEQK